MSSIVFDEFAAGAKTLWVIRFNNHYNDICKKPSFELYLPKDQNSKKLIKVTDDLELQAVEFFILLQKICEKIKTEWMDKKSSNKSYKYAFALIRFLLAIFSSMIKQLYRPVDQEDRNLSP